jgi:ATP-dependent Clp protease, protease subunit
MEEVWYTITRTIDPNTAQQLIAWVNGQIYVAPIKRLKLMISSGGGDVDSAIRIYAYLKSLPIEVTTIGFSQIDSAANIIFLGGEIRLAVKNCRFFLHEGTFTIGNPTASLHIHEETLTILKELLKKHIDILSKETGKSTADVKKTLEEGRILTTEQAKEFGLVQDIIEKLPLSKQT